MKFSEAMLKGYKLVGGKQCTGRYHYGPAAAPIAVCVWGAWQLAVNGNAADESNRLHLECVFSDAWGVSPLTLNDEGMPWEHIYGMAVAAGL